jgi:hypothetical protein
MTHNRFFLITCVAVAALAIPQALYAQPGRGGGGGAGRVNAPAGPPVVRAGKGGGPAGAGHGIGAPRLTRLENNTALSARIQPLLPAGADMHSAAMGFRNDGEFIAALHVSRNLGIPFDQLKSRMTDNGQSLGKAIQTLRPELPKNTVKEAVRTARLMANDDVRLAKAGRAESKAASEIQSNPALSERLAPLLPEGMTVEEAAFGFKNTGQFVAALHVAKNLNIPFHALRARMIEGGESLGEAIRALRPEISPAEVEASASPGER